MRKPGLNTVESFIRRIGRGAVNELTTELRTIRQRASDGIPRAAVLLAEKWLEFWLSLVLIALVGFVGQSVLTGARWASDIRILARTVPFISYIGILGFLAVLVSALGMVWVTVISAIRLLVWLRDVLKNYWNRHTPRFHDDEPERPAWPPSKEERETAMEKWQNFGAGGASLFMLITTGLLYLETNHRSLLYDTVKNPDISSFASAIDTVFWVIDVEALFRLVAPNVTQTQAIFYFLILVVPGIFMAVATRNFLFNVEAVIRDRIEKAAEGSRFGWRRLMLAGLFLYFSLMANVLLINFLYQPPLGSPPLHQVTR